MEINYLDHFDQRMKHVGSYAVLFKNSFQKGTWKNFGFDTLDEQVNILFAVLLYIMEQSLREEVCTIDDIASFLDTMNQQYFHKELTYDGCKELSDFIMNSILCNEGKAMYFQGYNFNDEVYEALHISFIQNRVVYLEGDQKRTSYCLTNEGYSMLLSTLELEGNMKLTIHEMIFKLHLEKATYDEAATEVRNIFNQLRIRLQNMQEAMSRIRRNALDYTVKEYEQLLAKNMESLNDTSHKYEEYRKIVQYRVQEFDRKDIDIEKLDESDLTNLKYLKIIEQYLNRSIDELQQLMITHFDYKNLYSSQLESISQMSMVKRFDIRKDLYDRILDDSSLLDEVPLILRPLLNAPLQKTYNVNKAFQLQKIMPNEDLTNEELVDFDEGNWERERRNLLLAKIKNYRGCLKVILKHAQKDNGIKLSELKRLCEDSQELKEQLIPNAQIFREVIIELLKAKIVDIERLQEEQTTFVYDTSTDFQLNIILIDLMKDEKDLRQVKFIQARRIEGAEDVVFHHVLDNEGMKKRIRCSEIYFEVQ